MAILAHFDSTFSGPIPCRVIAARRGEHGLLLQVEYTAARGPYSRGERAEWLARNIIPRDCFHKPRGWRSGHYYRTPHNWCDVLASAGMLIADMRG